MTVKRPGGFEITEKGLDICNFQPGAKILDIGCGEGDSCCLLRERFGYSPVGIDISPEAVKKAQNNYPQLEFQVGDGEFLENFSSGTFDGVLMECVLSQINLPLEAVHEAYCVLRPGGKLFISGLYRKNPTEEVYEGNEKEVTEYQKKHQDGQLTEADKQKPPSPYRWKGVLLSEPLRRDIQELGFRELWWEDRTEDLITYGAEILMAGENLEDYIDKDAMSKNTGYFFSVYEKTGGK